MRNVLSFRTQVMVKWAFLDRRKVTAKNVCSVKQKSIFYFCPKGNQ